MPPPYQPESAPLHVLVADEDAGIRRACCEIATHEGMVAHEAELTSRARCLLLAKGVDIVLVDEAIATGAGFELLEELRQMRPDVAVVWMTSASTVQLALEALRFGASDYLIKPFSGEELSTVLRRLAERHTLDAASRGLRERLRTGQGMGNILGESPEMEKLYRILARVAQTVHPVLILGESGTGKELVARADPRQRSRGRQALRPGGLRFARADSDRERAVRPRQGRVHRRASPQRRPAGGGRERHGLPGRGRRVAARPAGQAAARAAGERGAAAGRRPRGAHSRARSWPRPIRIWPRWSSRGGSAGISTTG